MIKLTEFANLLGANHRSLREAMKKNKSVYPPLYKMPGRNGNYMVKKSEVDEWLQTLKVI